MNVALFGMWNSQKFSLEEVVFPELVKKNSLLAVPLSTKFIDIGIPEDYDQFCRWVESEKTVGL
jgi:NDP-sugar pyrophosphorylase family protein